MKRNFNVPALSLRTMRTSFAVSSTPLVTKVKARVTSPPATDKGSVDPAAGRTNTRAARTGNASQRLTTLMTLGHDGRDYKLDGLSSRLIRLDAGVCVAARTHFLFAPLGSDRVAKLDN
jgi:hypothetical protein